MIFKISTAEGVVSLTAKQVADTLMQKTFSDANTKVEKSSAAIAEELLRSLERKELLRTMSPRQTAALGITIGYYLNTLLRKNEVEIEEQEEEQEVMAG